MTETTDIHALAGAYALDAVDDVERAAYEAHLRRCEPCEIEIASFRETTARLASEAAEPPPAAMRAAVLAAIARTPQTRGRAGRDTVRAIRWQRWAAAAVAASVLAAGAGAATWTVADQRVREERVQAARIDAVLAAPDARLVAADLAGGRVSLVVSPSRDAAVAVLRGLTSPGSDRAYQLWMLAGSGATSVGVLPTGKGDGRAYIAELGGADTFALSNEPAGGSTKPTLPTVGSLSF